MTKSSRQGERLLYVMGASGSGKDTLLRMLHERIVHHDRILIAHRYITRPSGPDESSMYLDPEEYERRAAMGCFALQWRSHGLAYGVGIEIDAWMAAGITVLVNGSRAHLAQAHARYPALCAVEIVVDPGVLAQRLSQRGRESADDIAARLARASLPYAVPQDCKIRRLDNNSAPETAAAALLDLARRRGNTAAA